MTLDGLHAALQHTAAGCNRSVGCLSWGTKDLIIYGSHRTVVVYDTQMRKVIATLLGHSDLVTCVKWVQTEPISGTKDDASTRHHIVSGGADGTVRVWLIDLNSNEDAEVRSIWKQIAMLEVHSAPITSVTVGYAASDSLLLVTTAGDFEATIWTRDNNKNISMGQDSWLMSQRMNFGTKIPQCSAIGVTPDGSCTLIALGFADNNVRIFSKSASINHEYNLSCTLSGHQNWVRSVDFVNIGTSRMLLASGGQDKHIRLWSIELEEDEGHNTHDHTALNKLRVTKYAPKPRMILGGRSYVAILESLLVGHEDWVMSVAWNMRKASADTMQDLVLLSSSMDRTMILWRKDAGSGIWLSSEVVGDAGINHLGYYTCSWDRSGSSIAAHGYTGALHVWERKETRLCPKTATSGHVAPIVDACWSHDGEFLLTASTDQTARIFSKFRKRDSDSRLTDTWCELARPQVHGHDFSCLALVPYRKACDKDEVLYVYASGSEEKVIRIFESPETFLDTLQIAKGRDTVIARTRKSFLGATLPALGLSNKAIIQEEEQKASLADNNDQGYSDGADLAPMSLPSVVFAPPLEEHLSQNTLWPETHKLYGHGNDLYCICSDISGKYIASACRAQSQATAGIIVWSTETWSKCCTLECHSLTVTQLVFSPCGSFLASVGRDRKIGVHQKVGDAKIFLTRSTIKGHPRIIWSADWSPDSKYLATGSRDSKIRIWQLNDGLLQENHLLEVSCESSVQAVSFCRKGNSTLLAAGFEDGSIKIFEFITQGDIQLIEKFRGPPWDIHAASVRRVCWKPNHGSMAEPCVLASVGDDHSVKIWNI